MRVLFITSEVDPYAKSGGLADVTQALPRALNRNGVDARVIMPLYSCVDRQRFNLKLLYQASCVQMGGKEEWFSVYHTSEPNGTVTYFIEYNNYFGRAGLYNGVDFRDYPDNAQRFAFFCRAALQTAKDLGFRPDVVHAHDWMTGFVPYYLKKERDPFFENARSVFTIHNLGFGHQGVFSPDIMAYCRLDHADFVPECFEALGQVNLMKMAINTADKITTVSPTYAREILTPEYGCGLEKYLQARADDLSGILNGIDIQNWTPNEGRHLTMPYGVENYRDGKAANKNQLQRDWGLNVNPNVPIFGWVNRLSTQKGLDIMMGAVEKAMGNMDCQFVMHSSGEKWAENTLKEWSVKYPGKIGVKLGFYKNEIAHQIKAGGDFYLMPSLYEPCGLNQMYSQAFGTLPVVRETGGLADSVDSYNEHYGVGTGFKFKDPTQDALYNTVGWAVSTYYDRPHHMDNMIRQSMSKDSSWGNASHKYIGLYDKAVSAAARVLAW
ncbi:MAG: glycogen synthase [Alphaproteobacteria bacterium]|nr:glycogen synthase [Alphaproteobacteria bacterium]